MTTAINANGNAVPTPASNVTEDNELCMHRQQRIGCRIKKTPP